MPSINFQYRLVFDKHFFDDIKTKTINTTPSVMIKLIKINDRALGRPRTQNVISRKLFDRIVIDNPNMVRAILRAAVYGIDNNEIEQIEDEIERTIKLAIDVLDEPPNNSLIITSERKVEEYKTNPHFKDVKEIKVKAGQEALIIINNYFEDCTAR